MYSKSRKLVVIFLLLYSFPGLAQPGSQRIQLNQIGFFPEGEKIAIVTGHTDATTFSIISVDGKKNYFNGRLSNERQSENSTTLTRIADFTAFTKPGTCRLRIDGVGESYPFKVNENVFDGISKSVLKAFYFMRSDVPLLVQYAGKWARPAGHPDTVVYIHSSAASAAFPEGTVISSPRGWYDAGDYNKYIVNSGITTATLLSAYEDFPVYFKNLKTNIPESDNRVPDILDEALYNLRWMLTMQDPSDGGVYHKLTNAEFDGMVMPGVTKLPRYVVRKSTAATLDFTAVMARASRIFSGFKKQLPGLSDSCLQAAEKAWQWAMKNPEVVYNQLAMNRTFKPSIETGAYGDRIVADEWMWSAAELFATTRDQKYLSEIENRMNLRANIPGWSDVTMLGYYTLIRNSKKLGEASVLINRMKDSVLTRANGFLNQQKSNAFATVMGGHRSDFVWGSNAVAANQGVLLINAYLISGDKKYVAGAVSNLDYVLGRNATGYCFVTGGGMKSPMHPHHRPSESDNIVAPIPGMLVGGPNPGQQDKCEGYPSDEPELSYLDAVCSYATNEIAINWNASMVYLANALNAIERER